MVENLDVDFGEDHQETDPHIVRVGWSMDSTSFQLGKIMLHTLQNNPVYFFVIPRII